MKFIVASSLLLSFFVSTGNAQTIPDSCFNAEGIAFAFNAKDNGCGYEGISARLASEAIGRNRSKYGQCAIHDYGTEDDIEAAKQELRYFLKAATDADAKDIIDNACLEAYNDASHGEQGFKWTDLLDVQAYLDVSHFFTGRSEYNGHRETKDVTGVTVNRFLSDLAQRIKNLDGKTKSRIVEHPPVPELVEDPADPTATDFTTCEYSAAMCCWVQDIRADENNGNCATPHDTNCVDADPADNTDLCYTDYSRSQTDHINKGYAVFPQDDDAGEGAVHCHGWGWSEDLTHPTAAFKSNNAFYVSAYDHWFQRGYATSVAGMPMCACLEQMPTVARSDCTQINTTKLNVAVVLEPGADNGDGTYTEGEVAIAVQENGIVINYAACQGTDANGAADDNNLESYMRRLKNEAKISDETFAKIITVSGDFETGRLVGEGGAADATCEGHDENFANFILSKF